MNLKFAHHGLQFFFITLCVAGRRRILSRLIDEKSRPELTPLGECVVALWKHLHVLNPALTASNSVIMPDHVHLLLIVNFDRDPAFRPLVFIHWFMEETERMIAATDGGRAPAPLPSAIRNDYYPFSVECGRQPRIEDESLPAGARGRQPRIEDESLPAGARGRQPRIEDESLPAGARGRQPRIEDESLPAGARGRQPRIEDESLPAGARGRQPPSFAIWDRSFWLDLSFSSRQLKAIRRYIRLNPARALWKARHPDRFIRFANIRHPVLDPARRWDAMGNLTLLASPFLHHVRLTMRKTAEEHAAEIDGIMERAVRGLVPVSGFISPGEKELLRRLKAEPQARFIKTVPFSLPPRYDPSAEDSRELAADRLLILSGFPQGTPDSRENLRARCNIMNSLAAALCSKAAEMA